MKLAKKNQLQSTVVQLTITKNITQKVYTPICICVELYIYMYIYV